MTTTTTTTTTLTQTLHSRSDDEKLLEINPCKLCGKFSGSRSKRTSGRRRKREVVVDVPGNESVLLENNVVRISGKLTRIPAEEGASSIPRYKFHFRARIKNRFQVGNSTLTIPIDLKGREETYRTTSTNVTTAANTTAEEAKEISEHF